MTCKLDLILRRSCQDNTNNNGTTRSDCDLPPPYDEVMQNCNDIPPPIFVVAVKEPFPDPPPYCEVPLCVV